MTTHHNPTPEKKTQSEIAFEQFCNQNSITFTRVIPNSNEAHRHPDYIIECGEFRLVVEIKEMGDTDREKKLRRRLDQDGRTGVHNPLKNKRVSEKINKAMPQLRQMAGDKYPAMLILFDETSLFALDGLDIRLGMFGEDVIEVTVKEGLSVPFVKSTHRFGRGQKVGASRNTTLSAVGLLRRFNNKLSLDIYHNHFAKLPLPKECFENSSDSQWRLSEHPLAGGLRDWTSA